MAYSVYAGSELVQHGQTCSMELAVRLTRATWVQRLRSHYFRYSAHADAERLQQQLQQLAEQRDEQVGCA